MNQLFQLSYPDHCHLIDTTRDHAIAIHKVLRKKHGHCSVYVQSDGRWVDVASKKVRKLHIPPVNRHVSASAS